jgi:hypothetical protein
MDLTKLAALKDKLVHATSFSEVVNYFLDHFGESPEFIALGQQARHPFLEAVAAQVFAKIFPGSEVVAQLLLTRLPEHQFIHGGCTVNGCFGTILYFEDVAVGLLMVTGPPLGGETKMARFTGKPAIPRMIAKPSLN